MAEKNDDQERTEEPTAHKLKQAREEGNVSKSVELSSVMLMVVTTIVFLKSGSYIYGKVQNLFEVFMANADQPIDNTQNAVQFLGLALKLTMEILAPLFLALFVTALLVNVAQTGVMFSTKVLEMKGSRIDPFSGMKRIVSMRGVVELIKGFSKLFILSLIIYFSDS